jgi:hypothetical protein
MSELTIDFVERLANRYPSLKPILDEHVSDNFGEVLPHVFFGDLTRLVVSEFTRVDSDELREADAVGAEVRRLLAELEDAYADGGEEIQELIAVSFLENLPRPGEEGSGVRAWLGPELRAQLRRIG